MNEITKAFQFENFTVRVEIFDGEPWWVAKDVAEALGYSEGSDTNRLVSKVPDAWKGPHPFRTPGGIQEVLCLSEQGLYFFLARSDKPAALPFQMWIAGEVLPSIRKTGKYAIPAAAKTQLEMLVESARVLAESTQLLMEQERRLASVEERVEAIETRTIEAEKTMLQLPAPTEEVAPLGVPAQINILVRAHAERTGLGHSAVWSQLYKQFRDRWSVDLLARARNKGKRVTGLEIAEDLKVSDKLYALAHMLYGGR